MREHLRLMRPAEAVDQLVWLLAGIMLCFWAVGSIYLYFFPISGGVADANDAISNSAIVAEDDSANVGADSERASDVSTAENNSLAGTDSDDGTGSKTGAGASNPNDSGNRLENAMKPPVSMGQDSAPAVDVNAIRKQVTASLSADHKQAIQRLKTQHTNEKKSLFEKFSEEAAKNSAGLHRQLQDSQKDLASLQRKHDALIKKHEAAQQTIAQNKRVAATRPNAVASAPATGQVVTANNSATQQPTAPKQTSRFTNYEFRNWKSNRGTDAWLAFVRWENGEIVLVDGQDELFKIPLNRLSESDQRYVQQLK